MVFKVLCAIRNTLLQLADDFLKLACHLVIGFCKSANLVFTIYNSPNASVPIIRNEELILLRAEANINLSQLGPAVTDLNFVRQTSGLLAPYAGPVDQASLINELLYNKRYSLMYEGGHSWIDYRRYGLTANLQAIDRVGPPPDVIFPTLPIPTAETQPR